MQEMDELENEEIYWTCFLTGDSSQKHRGLAVGRTGGCGPGLGDAGDHVRVRRLQ